MALPRENLRSPGQRLAYALAEKGLKQRAVAERIGLSETHFSNVKNDRDPLTAQRARLIEEIYGISAGWLLTGQGEMLALRWPVGPPAVSAEIIEEAATMPTEGHIRARVGDDSMAPTIRRGSIVGIDAAQTAPEALLGEVVAARLPDGWIVVRRLHQDGETLFLFCDNPNRRFLPITWRTKRSRSPIIGRVVWVWTDLRSQERPAQLRAPTAEDVTRPNRSPGETEDGT